MRFNRNEAGMVTSMEAKLDLDNKVIMVESCLV